MGAVYVAPFENIAVSAVQDLFELATATANSVRVRRLKLSTNATASEQLRLTMNRYTGAPTSGSGGGTATVQPLSKQSAASGVTVERNNTTRISGGTAEQLFAEFWNILTPYEWVAMDEKELIEVAGAEHFTVGLESAPAASKQISGWIEFEVMG